MLHLYRRHLHVCSHRSMMERRCGCPIWVQGKVSGRRIRKSLETRNWEAARRIAKEWEETGSEKGGLKIEEALAKFIEDCKSAGIGSAQLGKYELMKRGLEESFAGRSLDSITADDLAEIRKEGVGASSTLRGRLGRWKRFFRFCHEEREWISSNPARSLKAPREQIRQVEPFSKEEMEKIFVALGAYPDRPRGRRKQLRAFVLLLRWTGLRIRDVVKLREISDGKVVLRTTKTGARVCVPLPEGIRCEIQEVMQAGGFWSGNGNVKSCVADWQRSLKKLFDLTGIQGHAHKFRHFFAVDLLSHGVSVENVATILGNSPRIVLKHYAAWVPQRQEALDREVEKTWKL